MQGTETKVAQQVRGKTRCSLLLLSVPALVLQSKGLTCPGKLNLIDTGGTQHVDLGWKVGQEVGTVGLHGPGASSLAVI